jgi:hypothetical protein
VRFDNNKQVSMHIQCPNDLVGGCICVVRVQGQCECVLANVHWSAASDAN